MQIDTLTASAAYFQQGLRLLYAERSLAEVVGLGADLDYMTNLLDDIAVHERLRRRRSDRASLAQVDEALEAGAEIILLDNLSTEDIIDAVTRCRGRAKTEISGGVTLARMNELAATGADSRPSAR